jgi:hypothetical protein
MTRIIPPQGMKELEVQTRKGTKVIRAGKDGLFNIENPRLAKKLKEEGLGEAGLNGFTTSGGYPCSNCGFGSWFKKCSRCGELNERIEMDSSSG